MQVNLLFPTPVYSTLLQDTELELVQSEFQRVYDDHIKNDMFRDPWQNGRTGVTNGGFQDNIFDMYECTNFKNVLRKNIDFFLDSIQEQRRNYTITNAWMTQNKKYSYGHIHTHTPDELSGCYYFKKHDGDGNIFFECPVDTASYSHVGKNNLLRPSITFFGQVGELILFPSWLRHGVDTNLSDNERISISFNIRFTDVKESTSE